MSKSKRERVRMTGTYEGISPVKPLEAIKERIPEDPFWGVKRYIGYDHLFSDCEYTGTGGWGAYTFCRAKKVPSHMKPGREYTFTCTNNSSILTNIR